MRLLEAVNLFLEDKGVNPITLVDWSFIRTKIDAKITPEQDLIDLVINTTRKEDFQTVAIGDEHTYTSFGEFLALKNVVLAEERTRELSYAEAESIVSWVQRNPGFL